MWISSVNGPVAQWIRHRPTEPGIAGSSPAGVNCIGKSAKKKPCEPKKGLEALARPGARVVWKKWSHAGSNRRPYGY